MINNWDKYAEEYGNTVYSITNTPEKRNRIVENIRNKAGNVLIVGCGSAPHLQKHILEEVKNIRITASDLSIEMLKTSENNFSNSRLSHVNMDTRDLKFNEKFDYVITTNSILPETREDVLKMYISINDNLEKGGKFLGYFPSYSAAEEIKSKYPDLVQTDSDQSRCFDTDSWQCFHTEELLKHELSEAGFTDITIQKVYSESDEELEQLKSVYPDEIAEGIWEFFVVAEK